MYKKSTITITTKTPKQAKRLYVRLFMMTKPSLISVRIYNGTVIEIAGFWVRSKREGAIEAAKQWALKIKELKNTGIKRMIIDTNKISKHKLQVI